MLVATPGQAATYSLHGSSAPKKTCLTSSAAPKSTNNSTVTTSICSVNKSSSSNAASALMKTISVRLNRGTEFLKDTVQKALINNTTSSNNTNNTAATTASGINFRNTNNINTAVVGPLKHFHAPSAVAVKVSTSSNTLTSKFPNSSALAAAASTSAGAIVRTSIAANNSKQLKLNTVPPTKIHRYPQERQQTSSTDSINKEMCHFKPILSAPTMRWKCGSKSRGGATIKIPIACLATNIKNLNCDDCSMIADGSSEDEQTVNEDEVIEEGVNHPHKYNSYKPKPSSTLLTTIITSPSHQSAFVRLVAQMKTLVNIHPNPSEQQHCRTSKKVGQSKMRNPKRRGRPPKASVALRKSPINLPLTQLFLRSRKQPFVHVKNLNLSTELVIKKGGRKINADVATNSIERETKVAKDVTTKIVKRNATKSKLLNIVAFAQEKSTAPKTSRIMTNDTADPDATPDAEMKIQQRKRKRFEEPCFSIQEGGGAKVNDEPASDPTQWDVMPPLRKSARLSKDGGSNSDSLRIGTVKRITITKRKTRNVFKRTNVLFSPPMTRSRLKELKQQQSGTTLGSNNKQSFV